MYKKYLAELKRNAESKEKLHFAFESTQNGVHDKIINNREAINIKLERSKPESAE